MLLRLRGRQSLLWSRRDRDAVQRRREETEAALAELIESDDFVLAERAVENGKFVEQSFKTEGPRRGNASGRGVAPYLEHANEHSPVTVCNKGLRVISGVLRRQLAVNVKTHDRACAAD